MATELPGAVDSEDREIIAKLAKLQNMYSQIGGLRSLLPDKLINPARVALENPGGYQPEKLATYLQTAAKAGSQDVEQFKKEWHGEDVRQLWHVVNANDLPQGGDAWPLDYGALLQDAATNDRTSITASDPSREFPPPNEPEIMQVVDDFCARHPELRIHVSDGATPLPIDIQVGKLDFRLEQRHSAGATKYIVVGKPGTETSSLRHNVLQSISESQKGAGLATLLEMISSYRDINTKPCEKCHKLFDSKTMQLPLIRQSITPQEGEVPQFLALHRDCK
ncbi:hypothetical protein A1O7_09759 [Cladophialophora yegresii CBS 114405]|uniref:Mediator complex subunit 27 n=1 Tax=Cladophialophora yegresii CBS 114405 TaxID=1182544 RepID=W9VN55_9EURO|nr:uncharacterized protein A1O7_09759 [Cladophialophora yegresii CBS 114405]EXJ54420.1 hypothetical protein A1O7_09759 [Cladophialophora yegresii CBS 114405]